VIERRKGERTKRREEKRKRERKRSPFYAKGKGRAAKARDL
jgi:hypothetical protein